MSGLSAVRDEPLGGIYAKIAVALADEGVPVYVIGRSMKVSGDVLRRCLRDAVETGDLAAIPADDWAVGTNKTERVPSSRNMLDDEEVIINAVRILKTTKLQSRLLVKLMKRARCTKAMLHAVVEQGRTDDTNPTDPKIVDVVVCHLRKKLEAAGITRSNPAEKVIETIWGIGYEIRLEDRAKLMKLLSQEEPMPSNDLPLLSPDETIHYDETMVVQ